MPLECPAQFLARHIGQAGIVLDLVGLADLVAQLPAAEEQQAFAPQFGGNGRRYPRGTAADHGNIYTLHRERSFR